jgi:formylmethanofuran dehydrogenase subunit E
MTAATIGSYSFEEYIDKVKAFHGHVAPGLVVGGYMVDLALQHFPPGRLFDALSETRACLPDAVQLLTPCTIGNGWLKIINLGRFALSLYDKYEGVGVRVFVDPEKLEVWPEIKSWFFKLVSKKEQDFERLVQGIRAAGSSICGLQPIRINPDLVISHHRKGFAVCPRCRESYPAEDGSLCRACGGESPYLPLSDPGESQKF